MIKKRLLILLIALAFVFTGAPVAFAYECDHNWTYYDDDDDCCTCSKCGETKPHDNEILWHQSGTCLEREWIVTECQDCGLVHGGYGTYGGNGHHWSNADWWWTDNISNGCYFYGYFCTYCFSVKYAPITIKKGKTKRVLPKRQMKGGKVVKVTSSSKKVKAKKNGKVKGKKRGATAKVKWTIKYRDSSGFSEKIKYKAKVVVK